MKNLFIFTILFLLMLRSGKAQSTALIKAKKKIEELGLVDYGDRGEAIIAELAKVKDQELSDLMLNGKALEKVYAFWTYARTENADYRKYFANLVLNREQIEHSQIGCRIQLPTTIGGSIFNLAENLNDRYGCYPTYPEYLDSMALELEASLDYGGIRGNINCRLMNLKAPPALYEKVRCKAMEGNISAMMGLASYQKEQDVPLIRKHLTPHSNTLLYGLMGVEKFSSPLFEADVLAIFDEKMKEVYPLLFMLVCEVLSKYKSPKTIAAFEKLIHQPDKYYYQIVNLWFSVNRYPTDLSLRKQLIDQLGQAEINQRVRQFQEIDYWKLAKEEQKKKSFFSR